MSLAALERAQLLSRATSTEERQQYVEHLLTLPAYKDPQLTAYFADNVTLYFADLEGLQDQLVDAVLDLCEDEDEKNRVRGIQALARIGKASTRWVRGNTGVLLQLLESPPSELRHVRQALYDLLDVSPADVLSMMAEDCRGSEEETGASRRHILDFLQGAQAKRAAILHSGKDLEAEKVFAEGFYEVMETTAIAETRQILGLLLPLSTISGKNATPQSTGKFAKTLTRCLHPDSSVGLTTPLIRLWAELTRRGLESGNDTGGKMDPRWTLYFLADHGGAVVSLLAEKNDQLARDVLLSPDRDVTALKRSLDDRNQGDLNPKKLVPRFADTMLKAALRLGSSPKMASVLEIVLYPTYLVITANRSTRDAVGRSDSKALLELGHTANRHKNSVRDQESKEAAQWRNIRDMAEIMADSDYRATYVKPTWMTAEVPAVTTTTTTAAPKAQPVTSASTQRQIRPTDEVSTRVNEAPRQNAASSVSTAKPAMSRDNVKVAVKEPAPVVVSAPTSTAPTPSAPAPGPVPVANSSTGLSILSRAKQAPAPASQPTPPAAASSFSILAHAKRPATAGTSNGTAHSMDIDHNHITAGGPSRTPTGLSIRSAAIATDTATGSPGPSRPGSLLSRLSSGTIGKRARDEGGAERGGSASFGGNNGTAESSKRPRPSPDGANAAVSETRSTPSLLSRMSMNGPKTKSSGTSTPTGTSGFSLKRTGGKPDPSPAAGFTIRNRAATTNAPPPAPEPAPAPAPALAAPISASPRAPIPPVAADNDDGVFIRKGRGFAREAESQRIPGPPTLSERLGMTARRGTELL